jgi:hypothetical protein
MMCQMQFNARAGQMDYICAEDCASWGGRRQCINVPAATPTTVSAISAASRSLTISWRRGTYLDTLPSCTFQEFLVEAALTRESLTFIPVCQIQDAHATHCIVSAWALLGNASYVVRVREVCHDASLNSLPGALFQPVITKPEPAGTPYQVNSSVSADDGNVLVAAWMAGVANNCGFSSWEVELMYLPRVLPMGVLDPYAAGTGWEPVCKLVQRTQTSCVIALRENREYRVRVRETCTDVYANSPWAVTGISKSNPSQAITPSSLVLSIPANTGSDNFDFWADWASANNTNPDSCVFIAWEVQAKVIGREWPASLVTKYGTEVVNTSYEFRPLFNLSSSQENMTLNSSMENGTLVLIEIHLSVKTAADADSSSTHVLSFLVNGKWTQEEVFASKFQLGQRLSKQVTLLAWPVSMRLHNTGIDAMGFNKIWMTRVDKSTCTITEDPAGNNRAYSAAGWWVDGDETAPQTLEYSLRNCSEAKYVTKDVIGPLIQSGGLVGYHSMIKSYAVAQFPVSHLEEQAHSFHQKQVLYSNVDEDGTVTNVSTMVDDHQYDQYINASGVVYGCLVSVRNETSCWLPVARAGGLRYDARVREVCLDPTLSSDWHYLPTPELMPIPEIVITKPVLGSFLGFSKYR